MENDPVHEVVINSRETSCTNSQAATSINSVRFFGNYATPRINLLSCFATC